MRCPLNPPRKSCRLLCFLALATLAYTFCAFTFLVSCMFLPHLVRAIIFLPNFCLSSILAPSPKTLSKVLDLVSQKSASPLVKLLLSKFVRFIPWSSVTVHPYSLRCCWCRQRFCSSLGMRSLFTSPSNYTKIWPLSLNWLPREEVDKRLPTTFSTLYQDRMDPFSDPACSEDSGISIPRLKIPSDDCHPQDKAGLLPHYGGMEDCFFKSSVLWEVLWACMPNFICEVVHKNITMAWRN